MRVNASSRLWGRYDFAGVKRRPGAFTVWPGRCIKEYFGFFDPQGRLKK